MLFLTVVWFPWLCRRSPVCLRGTARPRDSCWLRGCGGDRRPSTSSPPGTRTSPRPSSIGTANPQVMHCFTHIHQHAGRCLHPRGPHPPPPTHPHPHPQADLQYKLMIPFSSGRRQYFPMLMRYLGAAALPYILTTCILYIHSHE